MGEVAKPCCCLKAMEAPCLCLKKMKKEKRKRKKVTLYTLNNPSNRIYLGGSAKNYTSSSTSAAIPAYSEI